MYASFKILLSLHKMIFRQSNKGQGKVSQYLFFKVLK